MNLATALIANNIDINSVRDYEIKTILKILSKLNSDPNENKKVLTDGDEIAKLLDNM